MLSDEEYKLILQLLIRSKPISATDRTPQQTFAYKKISKYQMKRKIVGEPYGGPNKKDRIIVNGKILLPMNEIQAKIFAFYKGTKGDGAKKLQYRMKEHYYGIGEKLIQKHLNNIDLQRKRRPRFENRAPLQPINSKTVMDRHQIDLVDMKSMIVKEGSKSYRYVLSVLGVFSRFVCYEL